MTIRRRNWFTAHAVIVIMAVIGIIGCQEPTINDPSLLACRYRADTDTKAEPDQTIRIKGAKSEPESDKDEKLRFYQAKIDELLRRLDAIASAQSDNFPVIKRSTLLHIIHSTVRIRRVTGGSGTGIVIYSACPQVNVDVAAVNTACYTYILTANHVVADEPIVLVDKFIYDDSGLSLADAEVMVGRVILNDVKQDTALIEVISERIFTNVVEFATSTDIEQMTVGEPLYAVGCQLQGPPIITDGRLGNFTEALVHHTASDSWGGSGGGLFTASGKLLGCNIQIGHAIINKHIQYVHHLVVAVSFPAILEWLDNSPYSFLVDQSKANKYFEDLLAPK